MLFKKKKDETKFEEVKEAMKAIPNMNLKEFRDEVEGETCIIMPIAIGI